MWSCWSISVDLKPADIRAFLSMTSTGQNSVSSLLATPYISDICSSSLFNKAVRITWQGLGTKKKKNPNTRREMDSFCYVIFVSFLQNP